MKKTNQNTPAVKERVITFTRHSSIDEHMKLQERLIKEMENLEDLEEEKKTSNKAYTDQINTKEALIKTLRMDLKEHKITLTQECAIIKDYNRGQWIFVDPATGEEVYFEKFTDADWQMAFDENLRYEIIGQPLQLAGQSQKMLAAGDTTHIEETEYQEVD